MFQGSTLEGLRHNTRNVKILDATPAKGMRVLEPTWKTSVP